MGRLLDEPVDRVSVWRPRPEGPTVEGSRSPRWKQRALYDAIRDVARYTVPFD